MTKTKLKKKKLDKMKVKGPFEYCIFDRYNQ